MKATGRFLTISSLLFVAACGGSSAHPGAGGAGGGAAGLGGAAGTLGLCNFGEPNDTRETATPLTLNLAYAGLCVGSASALATDPVDYYELTAPASDAAGGFVQVQIRNVVGQAAEFEAWSVSDNDKIMDVYTTTPGANVDGWFTVAPGGKYRVSVHMFAGDSPQFTYDLQLKYTAIVDAYEPNNARASAKPIAVGVPVMASAAVAALGATVADTEKEDWYSVTLAPGTATVLASSIPADISCDVTLYDPDGTAVDEKYNTTDGANCKLDVMNLVGGVYTIKYERFAGTAARSDDKPAPAQYLIAPYTLTVTQP